MIELLKTNFFETTSFVDLFEQHSVTGTHGIRFYDKRGQFNLVTYKELYSQAKVMAAYLQSKGVKKGDTVMLILPYHTQFVPVFIALLYCGAIPVPAYPPAQFSKSESYITRTQKLLASSGAQLLITTRTLSTLFGSIIEGTSVKSIISFKELSEVKPTSVNYQPIKVSNNDGLLIQYTSGSTSLPKGVYLTHRHGLTNINQIAQHFKFVTDDIVVSWLPLYHDMGLIGCLLSSCALDMDLYLFNPLDIIGNPFLWLKTISDVKTSATCTAPNFAYSLCLKKITDEQLAQLDLSRWKHALNGAEPIVPKVLEDFTQRFSKAGFKANTLVPVYGMAEATLMISGMQPDEPFYIDTISSHSYRLGVAKQASALDPAEGGEITRVVSCGRPLSGIEITIVDEQGQPLPTRHVGQVTIKGPAVFNEYYKSPEATAQALKNGWLYTGDRGYWADGQVFLTGRVKDMIIINGHNYYPHDIEAVLDLLPDVRTGNSIAFAITLPNEDSEKLVIVAETKLTDQQLYPSIKDRIFKEVVKQIGIKAYEIVLIPPNCLPKTTSGKKKRLECKELYLNNSLVGEHYKFSFTKAAQLALKTSIVKIKQRFQNALSV